MYERARFSLLCLLTLANAYKVMTTVSDCLNKCESVSTNTFCPSADLKSGYCCSLPSESATCPRGLGLCSGDFASSTMKQFMCPFQPYCGSSAFTLNATSTLQTMEVTNASVPSMPQGGMCQYLLATNGTTLLVQLSLLSNVAAAVVYAQGNQTTFEQSGIGTPVWFRATQNVYMVLTATGANPQFSFSYQTLPVSTSDGTWGPLTQNATSGSVVQTASPLILIVIGAGGALLIVAISTLTGWLVCKCVRARKKVVMAPAAQTEASGLMEGHLPYSIVKKDNQPKRTLTEEDTKPPQSSEEKRPPRASPNKQQSFKNQVGSSMKLVQLTTQKSMAVSPAKAVPKQDESMIQDMGIIEKTPPPP